MSTIRIWEDLSGMVIKNCQSQSGNQSCAPLQIIKHKLTGTAVNVFFHTIDGLTNIIFFKTLPNIELA